MSDMFRRTGYGNQDFDHNRTGGYRFKKKTNTNQSSEPYKDYEPGENESYVARWNDAESRWVCEPMESFIKQPHIAAKIRESFRRSGEPVPPQYMCIFDDVTDDIVEEVYDSIAAWPVSFSPWLALQNLLNRFKKP